MRGKLAVLPLTRKQDERGTGLSDLGRPVVNKHGV